MWTYFCVFIKRIITSASGLLAVSTIASVVAYFSQSTPIPLWAVIMLTAFFILKTSIEYRKLTFDPSLITKYQDTFDKDPVREYRWKAIEAIERNRGHLNDVKNEERKLSDIDDILDFFTDLGFYAEGGQISYEVIHHHFYHWLRGYWILTREYIIACQSGEPEKWENMERLFEATRTIECGVKFWESGKENSFDEDNTESQFIRDEKDLKPLT